MAMLFLALERTNERILTVEQQLDIYWIQNRVNQRKLKQQQKLFKILKHLVGSVMLLFVRLNHKSLVNKNNYLLGAKKHIKFIIICFKIVIQMTCEQEKKLHKYVCRLMLYLTLSNFAHTRIRN